jgi:hypothetical protein
LHYSTIPLFFNTLGAVGDSILFSSITRFNKLDLSIRVLIAILGKSIKPGEPNIFKIAPKALQSNFYTY